MPKRKKIKNYGVLEGKRETDYIAGTLPYREVLPSGDWTPYLPKGENQYYASGDTMACVSFSAHNCIETQIKFYTGKEVDFSDRFLAKMSGTTRQGNYLYVVADTLRKYGTVLEEEWPAPPKFTWEDYYSEIPQYVKDKAKKFLEEYEIAYEWIPVTKENLLKHLKHAPLQLVFPGHAVMGFYSNQDIVKYFDTYEPYVKQSRILPKYALKIVLYLKEKQQGIPKKMSILQKIVSWFKTRVVKISS